MLHRIHKSAQTWMRLCCKRTKKGKQNIIHDVIEENQDIGRKHIFKRINDALPEDQKLKKIPKKGRNFWQQFRAN